MPVHLRHPARTLLSRMLPLFALILAICGMAPVASAQTDPVNMSVWKMIYGVTDAQAGSGAWLAADDDGDGVSNGSELAAGTNPFKANSTVVVTSITSTSTTVSLTFPTVPNKLYTVQATPSLNPTAWSPVAGVFVVGDGTPKTLVPPKGSNKYFRVVVQDQSSAGDSVSDWAKQFLGYALGSSIGSQSIYSDPTSLNAALIAQMVVTVVATAPTTTQPATNTVPTSGLGEFTITRSGYFLLSQITVPITAGGTAVPGTDYVALPASVTFLPKVKTMSVKVTPRYNSSRTTNATVTLAVQGGTGFTVGTPASAVVTVYPADLTAGTGLTGAYYTGSSTTYRSTTAGSPNLGGVAATYSYTQNTSTSGTVTVTHSGAAPFSAGASAYLSFNSGVGSPNLSTSSTLPSGASGPLYDRAYVVTAPPAAQAPVTISLANPAVITWNNHGLAANTPVTFATTGALPAALTAGTTYYVRATGLTTNTFQVSTTSGGASSVSTLGGTQSGVHTATVGTFTVAIAGTNLPASDTAGTSTCFISAVTSPTVSRLDPTLDFTWGSGLPSTTTTPTASSDNWVGRFDSYLSVPTSTTYDFSIQANDGARVYIDLNGNGSFADSGETLIDAWAPGSSTFTPKATTASVTLNAGTRYRIRVEYLELNQSASVVLRWKKPGDSVFAIIPSANTTFLAATGSAIGWTNLYWTNTDFIGQPRFAEYPASINLNWGTGQPSQTLPFSDNFSVRWEGYVSSVAGGTYNFNALADDGAVIYIDLNQNGTFDGGTETVVTTSGGTGTSPDVTLAAGQRYKIRVDFTETTGNASIKVGWKLSTDTIFALLNASTVQTGTSLSIYRDSGATSTTGWWASYYTNATLTDPPLYSAQDISATSLSGGSAAVTILIASPAVVTWPSAHGLSANTPIVFSTTGALPTGMTAGTTYFVASTGLTATAFQISTSAGGTALNTSGTQSGTHTASPTVYTYGSGKPANGNLGTATGDNWSSRFDAYLKEPGTAGTYPATYQFQTSVQAGGGDFARLLLDGIEVIPVNSGALSTITVTAANPAVVTWSSHGLTVSTPVVFTTTGALPTGLTAGTTYYVSTVVSTSSFQVSATLGGASISTLGGTQSGTHTGSTSTIYSISLTSGQIVHAVMEHYNLSGNAFPGLWWKKPADTSFALVPAANLFTDAAATLAGVTASYWTNTSRLGVPAFTNYPTQVSLAANSGVPSQAFASDKFSVSWEGYLQPTSGGNISFDIQADDGARVYLDVNKDGTFQPGELIIDAWTAGASTTTPMASAIYALVAGQRYKLRVEFYDSVGAAVAKLRWQGDGGSLGMVGIPLTNLYTDATTSESGVVASYYQNTILAGNPVYTALEYTNPAISYDFGSGRPAIVPQSDVTISIASPAVIGWTAHGLTANTPVTFTTTGALPSGLTAGLTYYVRATGLTADNFQVSTTAGGSSSVTTSGTQSGTHTAATIGYDNFTVRWSGQVQPQYSETYFFDLRSDDGGRVWINNQLVINNWGSQGVTDRIGTIALQAGVRYDIVVEYIEVGGTAEAHLYWYSNSQPKQIIPTARLFPTPTGTVPSGGNPIASAPNITSPGTAVALAGTGTPFSYTIAASNGAGNFIAPNGLPPGMSLDSTTGVLSATGPLTAGHYQVSVTATNAAGTATSVIELDVLDAGSKVTRDVWTSATSYSAFSGSPSSPSSDVTVTGLEDVSDYADGTGQRMRGYIIPPVTGNYYFWLAANNQADLWISNNSEPINVVRRAYVTATTGDKTWNTQTTQKSPWLSLIGGNKYYYEVRHLSGGGVSDYVAVGYQQDPTGNGTGITNGSGTVPASMLAPFDYPATTSVSGTLYTSTLTPASGVTTPATGYAFLRVNAGGTQAIVHSSFGGLLSPATQVGIYKRTGGALLFDMTAMDKFHPDLKTNDGGYTWNSPSIADLQSGETYFSVQTTGNPTGEIVGTFSAVVGSQTAPATPAYPAWTDDSNTDAGASRFLAQATFGASQADIDALKALTPSGSINPSRYRTWIDNQLALPANSLTVPDVLANLSSNTMFPYQNTMFWNSWWKNAMTAPDQLRQRFAFALSQTMVTSDQGPLNQRGRILADYYDELVDYGLPTTGKSGSGIFRSLLKQVTLTPAMGIYLDMLNNTKGDITIGRSANENYAREIMQLFSIGLYRQWPDGTLMLDSQGNPIPTYTQDEIKGVAKVFTGWSYGTTLNSGRLPTGTANTDELDPMVLGTGNHDLGIKLLLNNIMLPAATITSQSDTSTVPAGQGVVIQTVDPSLGQGNLISTEIVNRYDLYGVRELETTHDVICDNSSVGPYICRQLIQRLVTSNPKADYLQRVVQAFNGERNVDGVATAVRGEMKEVIKAILLDYEARSATAAADVTFGKQREPILRVTAPARAFRVANPVSGTYAQNEFANPGTNTLLKENSNQIVVTADNYRLGNGDNILLKFTATTGIVPSNQASYQVANSTNPTSVGGTFTVNATGWDSGVIWSQTGNTVTVTNRGWSSSVSGNDGYKVGAKIYVKFTRNGTNATDATPANDSVVGGVPADGIYTILTNPSTGSFTFSVANSWTRTSTSNRLMIAKLTGGYTVASNPATSDPNDIIITCATSGRHDLAVGDHVWLDITGAPSATTSPTDGEYIVDSIIDEDHFNVLSSSNASGTSQPNLAVYALVKPPLVRTGAVTVQQSTYAMGSTTGSSTTADLNQSPLNSPTVFNYFYPDFKYGGNNSLAQAGLTVPEFQLTTDSNLVLLQNFLNGGFFSSGNGNGYTSFRSGSNVLVMDLNSYINAANTSDANVGTMVDSLNTLLCAGQLLSATKTAIVNHVAYSRTISSVSATSPAVVTTSAAHGLTTGEVVYVSGVTGGTYSNGTLVGTNIAAVVTVLSPTTFSLIVAGQSSALNCSVAPTAGQLTAAKIVLFPYTTPTTTEMRDRARAVAHLIISSAEFAIQK